MDKLPLLTAYNLLVGARTEKKAELERLRQEWEEPTRRQRKTMAKIEAKIAEYDKIIPEIEAFMGSKSNNLQPKE